MKLFYCVPEEKKDNNDLFTDINTTAVFSSSALSLNQTGVRTCFSSDLGVCY